MTGNKLANEKYYWHTGYPGGIKERTMRRGSCDGKPIPERLVLEKAVQRMLPDGGRSASQQFKNLRVYVRAATIPHGGAGSLRPLDVAVASTAKNSEESQLIMAEENATRSRRRCRKEVAQTGPVEPEVEAPSPSRR